MKFHAVETAELSISRPVDVAPSRASAEPEVAEALLSMATALKETGCLAQAECLERELLQTYMASLGPSHPETLKVLRNLADTLHARGQHQSALVIERRRLSLYRESGGHGHPDTLCAMGDVGSTLVTLGRLGEAERMLRRRLELATVALGKLDPHTLMATWSLAAALRKLGRRSEAADLFRCCCLQGSAAAADGDSQVAPFAGVEAEGEATDEAVEALEALALQAVKVIAEEAELRLLALRAAEVALERGTIEAGQKAAELKGDDVDTALWSVDSESVDQIYGPEPHWSMGLESIAI